MGGLGKEPEDPGGFIVPGGAMRVKEALWGPQEPCETGKFSRLFELYGSEYFLQ